MAKIQINTIEISGVSSALQALRLPFGKDCRSEVKTTFSEDYSTSKLPILSTNTYSKIHEKDMTLLSTLIKRGDEHSKVMRGIVVYAEISAPIWFYREIETYRIGRERLSSESTIHIQCKGLQGEDLEKTKDEISMGHIQKTIDMFSYQCLRRIWIQRHNHRLPMWHDFCKWIECLPFFYPLIMPDLEKYTND